jgi:hypothetical protein
MRRDELEELHYITRIENLPSIYERGILSHARAVEVQHISVAMPEIQDIRATKVVPGGRPLHEYVNLYFHARNPMMWVRLDHHEQLCVVHVSPNVLDVPGTVVTDQNASSKYVRFAMAPDGLAIVERERTFAEDWRHPDQITYWRQKSMKCAEVLVPDQVPPELLMGVYCSCEASRAMAQAVSSLPCAINGHLFFQEEA